MSNTYKKVEYVIWTLFYSMIFMIWYRRTVFRSIAGMTYKDSKLFLWCIVILLIAMGIAVTWSHQRNGVNALTTIAIPYGIYTAVIYYDDKKKLIYTLCLAVGFFFIMCCIQIFKKKNKYRSRVRSLLRKICLCFWGLREIAAGAMFVLMISIPLSTLFNGIWANISSDAINEAGGLGERQIIADNINTVLLFQEKEWKKLTTKQKLDALQIITDIEVNYLGITHEVDVETENMEEGILGSYNDSTYKIVISHSLLENGSPSELLETTCHEVYHSYQHSIVDVYSGLDEKFKKLQIFRAAASYEQEFNNYSDGIRSSYESYYSQNCESDARSYAQSAIEDYYKEIEEYLCGN